MTDDNLASIETCDLGQVSGGNILARYGSQLMRRGIGQLKLGLPDAKPTMSRLYWKVPDLTTSLAEDVKRRAWLHGESVKSRIATILAAH